MQAFSERRRHPRHKTLLGARVVFNNWNATIDCQVRDLSASGARIRLSGATSLPGVFQLLFTAKQQITPAEVVWLRTLEAGVRFVPAAREPLLSRARFDRAGTGNVLSLDTAREFRRLKEREDGDRQTFLFPDEP